MAKASPASKNLVLAIHVQLPVFMAVKSRGRRLPNLGSQKLSSIFYIDLVSSSPAGSVQGPFAEIRVCAVWKQRGPSR